MPSKASAATGRILALTAVSAVALTTGVAIGVMIFQAQLPDALKPVATMQAGSVAQGLEVASAGDRVPVPAEPEPIPVETAPAPVTVAERSPQIAAEPAAVQPPAMIGKARTVAAGSRPLPDVTAPARSLPAQTVPVGPVVARPVPPQRVTPVVVPADIATASAADPFALLLLPPGDVEVAETEEQAIAIEERLASVGAAYFELPPERASPYASAQPVSDTTDSLVADEIDGLLPAWATEYVNMRAAPDNDAAILAVLPADAEFRAPAECRHWCEVDYEGQRGFIYKSFIRR